MKNIARRLGEIKVNRIPEKFNCSDLWKCFFDNISDILSFVAPTGSGVGYLSAGQFYPDPTESIAHISTDGIGVPTSFDYYIDGQWVQLMNFAVWREGNWNEEKSSWNARGYCLASDLQKGFEEVKGEPGNYCYFAVRYCGLQTTKSS